MTTLLQGPQAVRPRDRIRFHHDVKRVEVPAAEVLIYLEDDRGVRFDITDRVKLGDLSEIEESVEEDLTEFVHGDLELPIRDADGAVERYLVRDPLGSSIVVRVLRQRRYRGRLAWSTVFGGVLDQPWSIEINPKDQVVSVHAFSYHKLLEKASAETVGRQITGRTGTVSAGNAAVTLSSVTDIKVGDILVLTDAMATEEHEISLIQGSVATTTATWDNAFTAAVATLKKAFHRNKSIEFLAGELFKAAGVDAYFVELRDIEPNGFPSPANYDGIFNQGDYTESYSLTIRNAKLRSSNVTLLIASRWYETPDPRTAWTSASGGVLHHGDWTPYLASEPATILSMAGASKQADNRDIGSTKATSGGGNGQSRPAWDHAGGDVWEWDINTGNSRIFRNGVQEGAAIESGVGSSAIFLEYDSKFASVWYSRIKNDGTKSTRSGTTPFSGLTERSTTRAGKMRFLAQINVLAMHEYSSNTTPTTLISIWDQTKPFAQMVVKELTVPSPEVHMWTMRTDGEKVLVIYQTANQYRLLIWSYPSWEVIGDYALGGDAAKPPYLTRLTLPDGSSHFVGIPGKVSDMFVVAPYYAGVVPLADFEGQSCAAAMKDLATLALCQFQVTAEKVGMFRNRVFLSEADAGTILEMDRPLARARKPVWEGYRTRATVTYRDGAGVEGEFVGGETGDSARTIEVDSHLVSSQGHAEWLASRLAGFFGKIRASEEVDAFEATELHVGDRARMNGRPQLVIESALDLASRKQPLTLLEI